MILGRDSILFIKHLGVWTPISCEVSNSMSESASMMGTTTRDNKGWETSIPTMQSYSISASAELRAEVANDVLSYYNLVAKKRSRELLEWRRVIDGGLYRDSGKAYIDTISDSAEAGGFITFNLNLVGFGEPKLERYVGQDFIPLFSDYNNRLLSDGNYITIKTTD